MNIKKEKNENIKERQYSNIWVRIQEFSEALSNCLGVRTTTFSHSSWTESNVILWIMSLKKDHILETCSFTPGKVCLGNGTKNNFLITLLFEREIIHLPIKGGLNKIF